MAFETPIPQTGPPSGPKTLARVPAPPRPVRSGPGLPEDDQELVHRARRGDPAAREELGRRCRRAAYLLALQLLRDPEAAQDLAQDAVLSFFATLGRFRTGRPIEPWLYAIVRNRARDLARRRRARPTEPIERGDDLPPRPILDTAPGPEADTARRQLQALLWRALGTLTEPQREILVLRDYRDLSYEEIARVLDVPLGTVMSRLHRARRAAREAVERERELAGACGIVPVPVPIPGAQA
jgi:RNA polymerase sigma-70 factor (ECF subfamily)